VKSGPSVPYEANLLLISFLIGCFIRWSEISGSDDGEDTSSDEGNASLRNVINSFQYCCFWTCMTGIVTGYIILHILLIVV